MLFLHAFQVAIVLGRQQGLAYIPTVQPIGLPSE